MNELIIKQISIDLNIKEKQVIETLNLLSEGNTIPFIARYRKEVTGSLDEEQIRSISEVYEYQLNSKNSYFDIDKLNFVIFTEDAATIPSELKKIMTVVRCIDFGKFMVIKEDTENE